MNDTVKHGGKANSVYKWMIIGCVSGALGTGCVAQQADLARIQKDLDQQITQIRTEKKALAEEIGAARAAIAESQELLSAQKADIKKMQSDLAPRVDLAQLNQKIKLMSEKDLPSLYGNFEDVEKKISDLQNAFEAQEIKNSASTETLKTDIQSIQITTQAHGEELQATKAQTATLAQQIDENNQSLNTQLKDFQVAFGQFKSALTDLGTELQTESQRASAAEAQLATEISTHAQQVSTDLATQQQAQQALASEQSQSMLQLQDTLKESTTLLGTRLDEQATHHTELQQQVASLQDKLNADTQALRNFLDQDVKTSMNQMVTDLDARQRPVLERLNALQSDVEALGIHIQADATQVQELSNSVVKLREAQDVMGSLLGKRGDEIIQQAGRLSERMNTVESHQTALTDQLQANTKKTSAHLTEVNASLTSIAQNLDQATQSLTQRLTEQEKTLATLNKAVQQFQPLKAETQHQIQQMQAASQLTDQLHQNVEQISRRLQDLEIHQSTLVGKLDSDAQTTTTHLQEVNQGIQSVAQALENVSAKLNARISNQEQQLNRAVTTVQRVQESANTTQTNAQHLNDLTETMNQLQEVITTIGTKLGERVDEHEDRLGQLAQRVNQLQGTKSKK
jgi:DNA repair exonuclease SbcCD ATPase subunit